MKTPKSNRLIPQFIKQTTRRLGLALSAACVFFAAPATQAQLGGPITNLFEGTADANGLDTYPGAAQGWTAGWAAAGAVTAALSSSNPLNGSGTYLNLVFSNTVTRSALYRPYGTYLAADADTYPRSDSFSVTIMPHKISFDFRVDSFSNTANGTNDWTGDSANDTAFILGTQSGNQSKPTASSSWWIQVFGAAPSISNPGGPPNKWLLFDGSTVSNNTSTGVFVDSGMAFSFGTVYHFDIINDPRDKVYQVTINNGVTTNVSPWLHSPSYAAPGNFFSDNVLTVGGGLNAITETLSESIDNIIIQQLKPSEFPPRITQLSPFYWTTTPTNLASLLKFTPQLNPPVFFPASKGLSFVASTAGGGSNDMLVYNGPGDDTADQSTNSLAYKLLVAHTTIPTNGIGLVLNGSNVSSGLSISGAPNFRKVSYNGLVPNTVYSGTIYVTNSAGAMTSRNIAFDTFSENSARIIEAEDFNFGNGGYTRPGLAGSDSTVGGLFFDNAPASDYTNSSSTYLNFGTGYVDKAGATNIDYFHPTQTNDAFLSLSGSALVNLQTLTNVYRVAEAVSTIPANDYARPRYVLSGARDFEANNLQAGEWMNYTRTFAPGNYTIYLRAASTRTSNGGNNPVSLNLVTSDPTQPGQTVTNLGVFNVPYTAANGIFTNVPLTVNTNNTNLPIYLSGQQTLQLSMGSGVNNNLWLNYLVLAPDGSNSPSVSLTSPSAGASFAPGANISLTASASAPAGTITSVQYFNGPTSLGSSASSPYTVSWNSVPTGKYAITAKATTSTGFTASSAPINITVGSPAKKVLFVVDSATESVNLNAGDQLVYNMTAAKGWSNYLHYNANVFAIGPEAANGFDMVIITANSGSSTVATTFREVPVPFLQYNQAQLGGRSGMTKDFNGVDYGVAGGQQTVTVVAVGDPAAAGYSGIQDLFYSLDATDSAYPNGNAIILTKNTNYPALSAKDFYYQAGAEMCSGVIAPATRMQFFCANADKLATNITVFGSNLLSAELDVTMANPQFTGFAPVLGAAVISGGNITIPFKGTGTDLPSAYSLYSSSNVNGPYLLDNSAIVTGPVGTQFQVVTTVSGSARYYRVTRYNPQ